MDLTTARWRKSSYSSGTEGSGCVEVAFLPTGHVALRDTKDRTLAPHRYPADQWHALLAGIKAGEFTQP